MHLATLVLIAELNHVSWLVIALVQVPDLEVFVLIYGKELTDSSCKPGCIITKVLCALEVLFVFLIRHYLSVIEIQETPLDLSYWIRSLMVPHRNGRCIILIIKPTQKK